MRKLLLLIIIPAVLFNGCGYDCKSYLNNHIRPLDISGMVTSKQKSEMGCFGTIIWEHQSKADTLKDVCYCVIPKQALWHYIEAGDSLHKSKNSLLFEVFRKDTITNFEFPCCSE